MPAFLGFLGVLAFSFTLPATWVAVEELAPTFVGIGREAVAVLPAALILLFTRSPWPTRRQIARLALVVLGVTLGWPLFSALALQDLTSAHSAVIVGLLPAATAVAAVLRAGEHPSRGFWLATVAGLIAVLVFAGTQGAGSFSTGDFQILAAVALAAIGYAEGGTLAREMGGWRVICWALVLAAPLTIPIGAVAAASSDLNASGDAWSASPTWPPSARCSGSSRGTPASPEAASRRSARSSSSSRCSRWRGRPCCSASTSAPPPSWRRSPWWQASWPRSERRSARRRFPRRLTRYAGGLG